MIVPVKMPEDGGIFGFVVLNPTRTSSLAVTVSVLTRTFIFLVWA